MIGGSKAYGDITITTQVIGYRKLKWLTHEQIGVGEVTLPPTELLTTGYWLSLAQDTVDNLRLQGLWTNGGTYHRREGLFGPTKDRPGTHNGENGPREG